MAFYGSAAPGSNQGFNLINGYDRPNDRGRYNFDNSMSPGFQGGTHAPADPEIHRKLDNLLQMVSDQSKVLDMTKNGFEELKENVTRLETRVLEIEKENMGKQAKEKKLPLQLSVRSYM